MVNTLTPTEMMKNVAGHVGVVPVYEHPFLGVGFWEFFSFLFSVFTARCTDDLYNIAKWEPRISAESEFEIVSRHGSAIEIVVASKKLLNKFDPNSSKCIVKAAIDNDPHAIIYIDNPSEELMVYAAQKDGTVIFELYYGICVPGSVIKAAVDQNPRVASRIPYIGYDILKTLTPLARNYYYSSRDGLMSDSESDDEQMSDSESEFPTIEACSKAVRKNGLVLEKIPPSLKTPEVCLEAVMNNKHAHIYC